MKPIPTAGSAEGSASKAPPAPDVVTPDCLDTAAHVIDVTLAAIPDAAERAAQERNRAQNVRQTAEECSRKKWPQRAQDCYAAATTLEAMRGCASLIPVEPGKPAAKPSPG